MAGNPLEDWNLARIVDATSKYVDRTRDRFLALYGTFFQWTTKHEHYSFEKQGVIRDYGQLRLTVLRAFSFIDAHKEAEHRLFDEFGETQGDLHNAFLTVMRESKQQVKLAEDQIKSKTKKQLKLVISHYMCTTLLNKMARFITVLHTSGILLARESRVLLEEIDESINHVRLCTMDEHPGKIEIAEDVEIGDNPAASMRRRKRKKQKSIL
jgi:hypothetical protein